MLLALRSLWEPSGIPIVTLPNQPGRVYKSEYPYWKPRKRPYWEDPEQDEEEELALIASVFMDD